MTKEEFIKIVNYRRRHNKNKWYGFYGVVAEKTVELKSYNTWLQIYRVNGITYPGLHGLSVKDFKEELLQPFN